MKKGVFLSKNLLLVISLTSAGKDIPEDILLADVKEISKSMFAAQKNIMSLCD